MASAVLRLVVDVVATFLSIVMSATANGTSTVGNSSGADEASQNDNGDLFHSLSFFPMATVRIMRPRD